MGKFKLKLDLKRSYFRKLFLMLFLGIGITTVGTGNRVWGTDPGTVTFQNYLSNGVGFNLIQGTGWIETVNTDTGNYYPGSAVLTKATVKNKGTTTLTNATVEFQFKNPDNTIVSTQTVTITSLEPGASTNAEATYTLGTVPLDVDGSWTIIATFKDSAETVLDTRSDWVFKVWRTVTQAQYTDMAVRCADWMDTHYSPEGYHTYPNYVNVGDGRTVSLAQMADILARALRYFKLNDILPAYVTIRHCAGPEFSIDPSNWMWKNEGRSDDGGVSWYDISYLWDASHYGPEYNHYVTGVYFLTGCVNLSDYINANEKLPNYVRVENYYYSPIRMESIPMCQFLYSMARYIRYYVNNSSWPNSVATKHMTVPQTTAAWEQNPDV